MDARSLHFPTLCPSCSAQTGIPRHARTDAEMLTLTVRCASCGHEWEIVAVNPPIVARCSAVTGMTADRATP
jgi:uncharacterized Zn finger protein